jgi:hypothetical protein
VDENAFDGEEWHEVDGHGRGDDETVIIRIHDVNTIQHKRHDAPF